HGRLGRLALWIGGRVAERAMIVVEQTVRPATRFPGATAAEIIPEVVDALLREPRRQSRTAGRKLSDPVRRQWLDVGTERAHRTSLDLRERDRRAMLVVLERSRRGTHPAFRRVGRLVEEVDLPSCDGHVSDPCPDRPRLVESLERVVAVLRPDDRALLVQRTGVHEAA